MFWPLSVSEAEVDLVMIQTLEFSDVNLPS